MRTLATLLILSAGAAHAQQTVTSATDIHSTSAILIEGADAPGDTQTVKTNPDVSVPPNMTVSGSCRTGDYSVGLGSFLFGGAGVSRNSLDEGCEARADARMFAELAASYKAATGNALAVEFLMDVAVTRMFSNRDDFKAEWGWLTETWTEVSIRPGAIY